MAGRLQWAGARLHGQIIAPVNDEKQPAPQTHSHSLRYTHSEHRLEVTGDRKEDNGAAQCLSAGSDRANEEQLRA